ncbi:MAG: ADP-ribosylation factor family protein [Candidatus Hodarchaeota archaeon]
MLRFFKQLLGRRKIELKIILLGLDAAGKSTFLKRMKLNEYVFVTTTMGFNQEFVELENLKLRVLDLGGQSTFRGTLWPGLLQEGADIIIFVVDAHDTKRISDSEVELRSLLKIEELKSASLCILANKQDLEGALDPEDLMLRLGLVATPVDRSILVFPTSMVTGEGLEGVYTWIKTEAEKQFQKEAKWLRND